MEFLPPARTLLEEIRDGVREDRIVNPDTVLAMMELALADAPDVTAAAAREITDTEADLLVPPTRDEWERRVQAAEARSGFVSDQADYDRACPREYRARTWGAG